MALSLIISRLQNNGLILSKDFKFKILFFAGLATQKFCSSWMITYIVRQERNRAMQFEIRQEYIVKCMKCTYFFKIKYLPKLLLLWKTMVYCWVNFTHPISPSGYSSWNDWPWRCRHYDTSTLLYISPNTASHPRRLEPSATQLWKPLI
jgi:hypothetical protein